MQNFIDFFKICRLKNGPQIFFRNQYDRLFSVLIKLARLYRRTLISRTKVIVVVGSLGKTTTTRAISAALGGKNRQVSYSNYGSSLAVNMLAIRPWDKFGVIEAGISRPGMMEANAYLTRPDIVVVTSIKVEHHRSFANLEETRKEKVKMVASLSPDGTAILNGDDPHVMWMATQTKAEVYTYGFSQNCQVRAMDVCYCWPEGMTIKINYQDKNWVVKTRLFGEHFVYPVLASIAVAIVTRSDVQRVINNLEAMPSSKTRLELISIENNIKIIDDTFKSGMDTFESALDMFAKVKAQRRIMVCGDIENPSGKRIEAYHKLGTRISLITDKVLFVGSHDLEKARASCVREGKDRADAVLVKNDVYEVIALLRGMVQPGDVILVKGRNTQRLQRVVLALRQQKVTCPVNVCNVKVHSCDECPMLDKKSTDFQNRFILPYIKK